MGRTNVLKVFFPHCLLNARSGPCIGVKDPTTQSICVLAVTCTQGKQLSVIDCLKQKGPCSDLDLSFIGTFANTSLGTTDRVGTRTDIIFEMEQRHYNGIPVCRVVRHPWHEQHGDFEISPLLILFDEVLYRNI